MATCQVLLQQSEEMTFHRTNPLGSRSRLQCEVLKSARKFSHGESDRTSQFACRERPKKGPTKPFSDCIIRRVSFEARRRFDLEWTHTEPGKCVAYA
ncbi:hypothetical protein AVEN_235729-1 [Araneus ventricosus]|uniref:Uncharacterized protein n=1 Tax=Araneus ventricosus TaxID=182803 RepID=A0A4Y2HLX2_ARAVE|nr:hypothetical protein AVEN_235729-1 [Araneus ventricosus]